MNRRSMIIRLDNPGKRDKWWKYHTPPMNTHSRQTVLRTYRTARKDGKLPGSARTEALAMVAILLLEAIE